MQFEPEVERWRSTVAKYFPPELVDKALWVIKYESGGNEGAEGDCGPKGCVARGLFQIQDNRAFDSRPSASYLDQAENNIRYAAEQLGAASGRWSDWGEGTTYQGKVFGALGNHPYPGDDASVSNRLHYDGGMAAGSEELEAFRRWTVYNGKLRNWEGNGGGRSDGTGPPYPFTPEEDAQFEQDHVIVQAWLSDMAEGGTNALDDILRKYEFWNNTDPALIDAQNTANAYARDLTLRQEAADISANLLREANNMQIEAVKNRQEHFKVDPISGSMSRQPGSSLVPRLKVPTGDQLFDEALTKLKANLPEVKPIPYPERPAGLMDAGFGQSADNKSIASILATAFAGQAKPNLSGDGSPGSTGDADTGIGGTAAGWRPQQTNAQRVRTMPSLIGSQQSAVNLQSVLGDSFLDPSRASYPSALGNATIGPPPPPRPWEGFQQGQPRSYANRLGGSIFRKLTPW